MSKDPAYTFLSWSRLGVANSIKQADLDASVKLRPTIPIDLTLDTETPQGALQKQALHKDVQLYGPGDIIGIDSGAVLRSEPHNWITTFESNLLAYIEFYEKDFPWRYTPAASQPTRLRPWIAVVALTEDEFEEVQTPGRPLPSFKLKAGKQPADLFPLPAQLWAWAHVHVNRSLSGPPVRDLSSVLDEDPDLVSSRIICPRHLAASKTYHAFLIPTFEAGRLAGLGIELPADLVATKSAWEEGQSEFPYYYRWQFRTGFGDFEYLVRLLKPQTADKRVGVRDIDVLHPGSGLPPINTPALLHGTLKLGGALQVPFETLPLADKTDVTNFDRWDQPPPHPFQKALAALINTADDYAVKTASQANPNGDPDPIVTVPLYGRWHALTSRLLTQRNGSPAANPTNWVHDLNLDPRWRVAAGLGTSIVQKHQEEYANAAWQQVGDVLAANRQLRLAQLAREAAGVLYRRHLRPLDESRRMMITAPVQRRILLDGTTVQFAVRSSLIPHAALATAFRAAVRPRGRMARRMNMTAPGTTAKVVAGLDSGKLIAERPWGSISGAVTLSGITDLASKPARQQPGKPETDPAVRKQVAASLSPQKLTPAAVDQMPRSSDFVVRRDATGLKATRGTADSADATRFKAALKDAFTLVAQRSSPVSRTTLGVAAQATRVVDALNPDVTVPNRYNLSVQMPARITAVQFEVFVPAMVYPEFDIPMYKPLADLSSELFLPNINLIPHNSITLLETNQRFIESYMTGLNHEMGRELLWREYPTDQRGSYFRQFWDVSSVYPGNPPPAGLREKLRDIPPLDKWSQFSNLGDHNQREAQGDKAQLVLVIRGELLKRYPNAVIFALKAEWDKDAQGHFDKTKERLLTNLDAAEQANPPKSKVRMPLYEARVTPDIFFIGFDLTAVEARGSAARNEAPTATNAGWFFVIQERPGEPRFGSDIPAPPGGEPTNLVNWNSLDWGDIGTAEGACINLDKTINLVAPGLNDQENQPDPEDKAAHWNPNTSAAELSYILYQVPVLVAVHAHRMLP